MQRAAIVGVCVSIASVLTGCGSEGGSEGGTCNSFTIEDTNLMNYNDENATVAVDLGSSISSSCCSVAKGYLNLKDNDKHSCTSLSEDAGGRITSTNAEEGLAFTAKVSFNGANCSGTRCKIRDGPQWSLTLSFVGLPGGEKCCKQWQDYWDDVPEASRSGCFPEVHDTYCEIREYKMYPPTDLHAANQSAPLRFNASISDQSGLYEALV